MLEVLEDVFEKVVQYGILILELIGALIIIINTVRSLYLRITQNKKRSKKILAEGISSGLGFLMSSEVLKTIIAPDWNEIGMTCAVLIMRAGMSVLINWEEKQEGSGT